MLIRLGLRLCSQVEASRCGILPESVAPASETCIRGCKPYAPRHNRTIAAFFAHRRAPLKSFREGNADKRHAVVALIRRASVSPITSRKHQHRHTECKARTWRTWELARPHLGGRRSSADSLRLAVQHAPIADLDGSARLAAQFWPTSNSSPVP